MKMSHTLAALALLCGSIGAAAAPSTPDFESRIDDLIARMTLEEKIGQLNQLSGTGYSDDMVGQIKAGQVGSILNEVDPATINKLQRVAIKESRLGIPLVFARDVIHGFRTIFPIPLGQAASFDPSLVEEASRHSAREAASVGIRWTFSPMVDIARDARWGRIAEGYGEDPTLASAMGVAAVRGYQGDDISAPGTMAACVKHFACYGAAESGRDYNTTWIPTSLLHDVYLPPFKACADAGAATFMCSFNDINGIPSSGNTRLMRDILRGDWGWRGLVVSDWNSIGEMVPHGYCADLADAARKGSAAGVDVDMMSYSYIKHLPDLVERGEIPQQRIDDMVRNVLRLKFDLGLFDNPYVDMKTASAFFTPEALDAARRAVEESTVMLKNSGVLPLRGDGKILVTGPMADAMHDQNGTWVFDLDKTRTVTPLAALREMYGDRVVYLPGLKYSRDRSHDGFAEACEAARHADVVLFFGGEEAVLSGEAHCRADITLPGAEAEWLGQLKQVGKPLVTVVMAGRPIVLSEESALSDALLYAFHPGTMGGPALTRILAGEVSPGGKLPVCLPRMSGQMPLYYAHKNTGRPVEEICLIDSIPLEAGQTSTGCTSYYLDAGNGPLYPFGYGLGYSTFSISEPQLSAAEMTPDGEITVSCTVSNTGSTAGSEVAQLYVRDMVASLVQPVKVLKAFEKVQLAPGESKTVTFRLPASALAFHDESGKAVVESGDFRLWVDNSSLCKSEPVSFRVVDAPALSAR